MIFFYVLVAIMPMVRHPFWSETVIAGLTLNKHLGLVCLVVALLHLTVDRRPLRLLNPPQASLFLLFGTLVLISFLTRGPNIALDDSPLANFSSLLLLFLTTRVLVNTRERLRRVLLSIVVGLGFVSLHALREWQKGGMFADARPGWVGGDPNYFALSLLLGLPLGFYLSLHAHARWERALSSGCLIVMLFAFMLAASRGGFIGLLVVFLFVALRSSSPARYLTIGSVVLGCWLLGAQASPLSRFLEPSHGDQISNQVRSELLEAGLRMFGDHMWFGVGVGNYKPLIGAYAGSDVELKHLAHNTYLEVAAEQGLFGLSLFLMILGLTLRSLRRTRKQGAASRDVLVSTAAGAIEIGLLGGAVAMLFLSALHVRLFWFMVALSACLPSLTAARRPARSRSSSIEPTQAALTHGR